jgi:hypothetical protein
MPLTVDNRFPAPGYRLSIPLLLRYPALILPAMQKRKRRLNPWKWKYLVFTLCLKVLLWILDSLL